MSNAKVEIIADEESVVTILEGEAYQPRGFTYNLKTVASVIELVKEKGSKENTVLFYNEDGINVILDDSIMDRDKDRAACAFVGSDELKEWQRTIGMPLRQKPFVDFLKLRGKAEMLDIDGMDIRDEVLAKVQAFKVATQIMGDYSYDDNNNFSVMFKTADAEDSVKFPACFYVRIPMIYGDANKSVIEVELQLNKPTSENEKPSFTLSCPRMERYWRDAVEMAADELRKGLDGYLILNGKG